MKKVGHFLVVIFSIVSMHSVAQVSILNSNLNPYNITPQALCMVSVMNTQAEGDVVFEAHLVNSANEPLLKVVSNPFRLKQGMTVLNASAFTFQSIEYGSSNLARHIQSTRMLPSGFFRYCCYIKPISIEEGDEYCQELEGNTSEYLYLVTPYDKDTIREQYPLLAWNHSEPFNILTQGEYYRIVLTELSSDQTAEVGVTANSPVYVKNQLLSHQVQYPVDAKKLIPGKRYGWQVHKMANGVVVNKSEAWEFTIAPTKEPKYNKYAVLKHSLEMGHYTAEGNRLFFKFDEEYSGGDINCVIYNDKREKILPKLANEDKDVSNNNQGLINLKNSGYNRFELNLDEFDITEGYHLLEVRNEKGELFLLKFYVP